MNSLVEALLKAPDSHLDSNIQPYLQKWSNPPTPIQVLEVLDYCVQGALASGTVMIVLNTLYEDMCKNNNTTHEEVVKHATWRNTSEE